MKNSNPTANQYFNVEAQIDSELKKYQEALRSDEEFYVLKAIRDKIKMLEDRLRSGQFNLKTRPNSSNPIQ